MSLLEPVEPLNLDFKQQELFVNYFFELPPKGACTVRFFWHGDFYVAHDDDATLASKFTGGLIKYMGDEKQLSYLVLKKSQFELLIRDLLLERQYRVEVYVKGVKINEWTLKYKGSPGNISQFEEILFSNTGLTSNNYVMALHMAENRCLAIALVNSADLKFELCDIEDNDCFSELESLLAQIGPRECVIPKVESSDYAQIQKALERNGTLTIKVKRSDFSDMDIKQDLDRLLFFHHDQQRSSTAQMEVLNAQHSLRSLQAAIKYLNLTTDERNFNQYSIKRFDMNRFVKLSNSMLYAMHIIPRPRSATVIATWTLLGMLDSCTTSQGKRLLEQWIKQPLRDVNTLNERLDVVEALFKDAAIQKDIAKNWLSRTPDLIFFCRRLSSRKASLQDCYRVYSIVSALPGLVRQLNKLNCPSVSSMLTEPLTDLVTDMNSFQEMIQQVLDMDMVEKGEFLIKATFSENLRSIYDSMQVIERKINKIRDNAIEELGQEVKLERTDEHGYFLRVTIKAEKSLRSTHFKRYKILSTIKGGVRFTSEKLTNLNEEYTELRATYNEEQKSALTEVQDIAAGYVEVLQSINTNIAKVDVFVSLANAAASTHLPYVRPRLLSEGAGRICIKKLRHPGIECQPNQGMFVPNSVSFGTASNTEEGGNDSNYTLHIITGPNMCGKSTFMQSVGICVLMAQIGSFVPCQYAEISLTDAILARVGGEDGQDKDLSTFMMEVLEAKAICEKATSNSLVLIDELGRATSTYDGYGIAQSIAEYLATKIRCFCLFATHFHEITYLADQIPNVHNLHVSALVTEDSVTPLYTIRDGCCDSSYGVLCAKSAGLPATVVDAASKYLHRYDLAAGRHLLKDLDDTVKRDILKEGHAILANAVEKLKGIEMNNLDDVKLMEQINSIKKDLKSSSNLFVKSHICVE